MKTSAQFGLHVAYLCIVKWEEVREKESFEKKNNSEVHFLKVYVEDH